MLRFKTALVGAVMALGVVAVAFIAAAPDAGASGGTTLVRGWNNVAYLGDAKAPADALAGIAGQYSSVYRWDATTQSYALYAPGAPAFANTITQVQPGDTLWLNYTQNTGSLVTGTTTGTGSNGSSGPGVISVAASAFMPMDDLAIYEKSYNQIGPVGTDAASKRYFAPVSLPNGVSPTSMTANFVGSAATVDVRLDYTPLSNGAAEASVFKIAEVLSSSGSSPQTAQAFTHTVDNSLNVYFLVVDLTGGSASQLNGVSIAYTQN